MKGRKKYEKNSRKIFSQSWEKIQSWKKEGTIFVHHDTFFFKLTTRHKILEHQNVKPRP